MVLNFEGMQDFHQLNHHLWQPSRWSKHNKTATMCRCQNCGQVHIDTLTSQKLREASQVKKRIELITDKYNLYSNVFQFSKIALMKIAYVIYI